MGISVDMFCKTYKANSKAKDKTFEEFIKKHITTEYVDYMTKYTYCDLIIKSSSYAKDGEISFIKINSSMRLLFFKMRLIELYTDIDIDDENVVNEYDKLNKIGAIDVIISAIPEKEYSEFSKLLNMRMDDFRDNEYSIIALLYDLKMNFNLSKEVINSVIKDLANENEASE